MAGLFSSDTIEDALARAGAQSKSTLVEGAESRENAAYGYLTTADKVTGIVLPTKGIIQVLYQATWKSSVEEASAAALFIGATQLKATVPDSANPLVQAALHYGSANWGPLSSFPLGLISNQNTNIGPADVATGQVFGVLSGESKPQFCIIGAAKTEIAPAAGTGRTFSGGVCSIFAAAGTYEIGVQYKASSGKVEAKNRRLYVWTKEFA